MIKLMERQINIKPEDKLFENKEVFKYEKS